MVIGTFPELEAKSSLNFKRKGFFKDMVAMGPLGNKKTYLSK